MTTTNRNTVPEYSERIKRKFDKLCSRTFYERTDEQLLSTSVCLAQNEDKLLGITGKDIKK